MPSITISTENDATDFAAGTTVLLTAKSDAHAESYQWKRRGELVAGQTSSEYKFEMSADTAGAYTVVAVFNGKPVESPPTTLSLAGASPPAPTPTPPPATPSEAPPVLHPRFALLVALMGVVAAWLIFVGLGLFNGRGGFTETVWASLEGRLKVGVMMALPLVVFGGVTLLTGLWMAVVDWRGRFKEETRGTLKGFPIENPGKIIEAVGKLRGAALAMVIGAILLISAAWVAQAAAGTAAAPSPPAAPSSRPAAPPSAPAEPPSPAAAPSTSP